VGGNSSKGRKAAQKAQNRIGEHEWRRTPMDRECYATPEGQRGRHELKMPTGTGRKGGQVRQGSQ